MPKISEKLIASLPKTDLHCHFDGSLRIKTLIELAKKNGVKLPTYEPHALMEFYQYGRVRKTLEEYLQGFEPLVAVLQNKDNIERVFFELCEDAARENVWHLEVRYCPYLLLEQGLSQEEVVEACARAGARAEKEFGMSVVQILCGLKHNDGASILSVAKLAARYRHLGVVAFDMAGPEDGFPIRDHLEAINFAKKNNLFITLHAGESYGPASIAQAIHEGGANRVGHGTSLLHDEELLQYAVDHRIGIESCPLSNLHTGSVKSLKEHPLKKFLAAGLRVSINTDNRLCSDTTITKEIMTMVQEVDLNLDDIQRLLQNGFKSAFLPYEKRGSLLKSFNEAWLRLIG
jgi:adenosine deaminase